MNYDFYLNLFQTAAGNLDTKRLNNTGLHVYTGIVLRSIALKIYKPEWSGNPQEPLEAKSRIFFSVWVNEKTIEENKLYYNIHALKLRELNGYKITSRDFAERFRSQFKKQHNQWPNVSTDYGPLTLMEGWKELNAHTLQSDIEELIHPFFKVYPIIDKTLAHYKTS